jgi:hypothetical protein
VFVLFGRVFPRRELEQNDEVDDVGRCQDEGIEERKALLRPDDNEPGEGRKEADDLDRVIVVEMDRSERAPAPPARVVRRDRVDHGPAEPRQEPETPGEVRDREVDHARVLPRLPRDDRLDGELRKRLDEGEDRQREPLRNEELRGLGAPRHDERREDHERERPDGGGRRGGGGSGGDGGRPGEPFAPLHRGGL